jgi:pilus assembly protein CpaE
MRTVLISICADEPLSGDLEAVAAEKGYGPAGNIAQYLANGELIDPAVIPEGSLPIAFVSLDADLDQGLATAEALNSCRSPRIHVITASATQEPEVLIRIMEAGYSSFLRLPARVEDVRGAIEKIVDRYEVDEHERRGRLVLFAGASGGSGTTTIATHSAIALASLPERRTLLIDHHRDLGHAALYLGLKNTDRSLHDLIVNKSRLDAALLDNYLVQHSSGLSLLCSPDRCVSLAAPEDAAAVRQVLSFLRRNFDYVVFDSDPHLPETAVVAAEADPLFLVVCSEIAPMRDLARYVEYFGRDTGQQQIIVTHEGRSAVSASHIASTCGLPVIAKFPTLDREVSSAINAGRPIPQKVKAFHEPLSTILGRIDPQAIPPAPKPEFFRWRR